MVDWDAIDHAWRLCDRLMSSAPDERVLLHGDFYAGKNALRCDERDIRGSVAIDPFPCVGERAYDAALWIVTAATADSVLEMVDSLAAEMRLDRGRLLSWTSALAGAQLCSCRDLRLRNGREAMLDTLRNAT